MTWRMLVAALALTGCDNSTPRPVPRAVTRPGDAAVSADAATEAAPFYSIGEAVGDAKASQLELLGYKPWRDLDRPVCVYKNDRVVVVDERGRIPQDWPWLCSELERRR